MSTSTQWQPGDRLINPISGKIYAALDKAYTEAWYGEPGQKIILSSPEQSMQWLNAREKAIVEEIFPSSKKHIEPASPNWIDKFTPNDNKHLIWTPPPGTFPEPEPKPEVIIPNDPPQHVGRWLCSVRAIVKEEQGTAPLADSSVWLRWWSISPAKYRMWVEAAPDADDGRSTRQEWADWEGAWTASLRYDAFAKFVQEIEQAPDCCSKHKILMQPYDGSECVGKREHSPPPALMPREPHEASKGFRFGFPGYKQSQQGIDLGGPWLGGTSSFKLHGFDVVTDPALPNDGSVYWIGQK